MNKGNVVKITIAAVSGIAGYFDFVGFYEMKYKVLKAMTEGFIEKEEKMKQKD